MYTNLEIALMIVGAILGYIAIRMSVENIKNKKVIGALIEKIILTASTLKIAEDMVEKVKMLVNWELIEDGKEGENKLNKCIQSLQEFIKSEDNFINLVTDGTELEVKEIWQDLNK